VISADLLHANISIHASAAAATFCCPSEAAKAAAYAAYLAGANADALPAFSTGAYTRRKTPARYHSSEIANERRWQLALIWELS